MKRLLSVIFVLAILFVLAVPAFAAPSDGSTVSYSEHGETTKSDTNVSGKYIVKEPNDKKKFIQWNTDHGNYKPGQEIDVQSDLELSAEYQQIMFREWYKGSDEGIYFLFAASDDLVIKVDKKETTEFTFEDGKIVLNPDFLESLDDGIRILEVYSKDGNFWDAFVICPEKTSKS